MWQGIIVAVIVALAAWYVFRRLRATAKGEGCGCGCDNCPPPAPDGSCPHEDLGPQELPPACSGCADRGQCRPS